MGYYSEYLTKQPSFNELTRLRKEQLKKISAIRKRPILVFASDLQKGNAPINIDFSDILPFKDQLLSLEGSEIDIILHTPGGYANIVEDLVNLVRMKFDKVGIIIPGAAYSAGTIFALAADEIFMSPTSSLGPIDAQITNGNKHFSADAFLEGLEKIKTEVNRKKRLPLEYIPILQNISPGEIQSCENAQKLSQTLVENWLKQYKFKFWNKHKSTGNPVTEEEKKIRANEIACALGNQREWLAHGRSIKIDALRELGLKIEDYSIDPKLNEAIERYYSLLSISFETNIYKIYETANTQILRSLNILPPQQNPNIADFKNKDFILVNFQCPKCKAQHQLQINFKKDLRTVPGAVEFPKNNIYKCSSCKTESNLLGLRQKIEANFGKKIF